MFYEKITNINLKLRFANKSYLTGQMTSQEIRQKFLKFFEERGHKIVSSSSLLPDDPSVLLTTAGMQQFKKYYTEPNLALAKNVASVQKCFRTSDIDKVGDESHLTFFEMLGNFSFGGYWKEDAIKYAHEFLTKELGLAISYVTVFKGSGVVVEDKESKKIWQSLDVLDIREEGMEDVFWGPTGTSGPCGPTTEIYCKNAEGKDIEIWNIVFNEFFCHGSREALFVGNAKLEPLKTKGIDTGMGLERLVMVVQGKKNIFETDLLEGLTAVVPRGLDDRKKRIFADHGRAIVFLVADGIMPSNKEAGYILRRLLRRLVFLAKEGVDAEKMFDLVEWKYRDFYPNLSAERAKKVFKEEYLKFNEALERGLEEMDKMTIVDAKKSFLLFETFGIPFELIKELAGKKAENLTREEFMVEFKKHQEISRAGSEKKFGGHGLLLNTGELRAVNEEELKKVTRLHTATHLLQAALRKVLGDEVKQVGSDITAERTRFDFSLSLKITEEKLQNIENIVNDVIAQNLPVNFKEMPIEDAKKTGALFFFKEKYPDIVKVYTIGPNSSTSPEPPFSRELCGGPHVKNTSEIGHFKILKSESIGSSTRRIRATIE